MPIKILFCDMDGTVLNSKSKVTPRTADALSAAIARGVRVICATGKTRPAAMIPLDAVGLAGPNGAISLTGPGVFIQGLQVYGQGGKTIHSARLDSDVVGEVFPFSVEHQSPLMGFSGDRCVTMFRHPLVDKLNTHFYEPKAEVFKIVDELKRAVRIQKVLFYDTSERVSNFLRPYWTKALRGRGTIVQAQSDMMEILPVGQSKGAGVKVLLDHLQVPPAEVMAIGDGENDIEMLELAGWGVAMGNGVAKKMAKVKAVTGSNDEDGVAQAIHKYILNA